MGFSGDQTRLKNIEDIEVIMGTHGNVWELMGVLMGFGGAKVTYIVQGQPKLQLLQSSVDWPQAGHDYLSQRFFRMIKRDQT